MTWWKNDKKLLDDEFARRVYCPYCGQSIVFDFRTTKKICSWCKRYVYNKTLSGQKAKFRDNYKKEKRKLEISEEENGRSKNKDK